MITAPLAGRLMDRYNAGLLGGIGLMIFGTALLLLAMMPAHPSHIDIIWRMFLGGIGFGLFITPTIVRLLHRLPENVAAEPVVCWGWPGSWDRLSVRLLWQSCLLCFPDMGCDML